MRPAHDTDADIVAALINAINSLNHPPTHRMTAAIVRRDPIGHAAKALLRVAELDGRVDGFATAGLMYDAERVGEVLERTAAAEG